MGLERLFYWQESWLHSQGDLSVDLGHLVVSGLLTTRLLEIPVRLAAVAAAEDEAVLEAQSRQLLGNERVWLRAIGHKVRGRGRPSDPHFFIF